MRRATRGTIHRSPWLDSAAGRAMAVPAGLPFDPMLAGAIGSRAPRRLQARAERQVAKRRGGGAR